MLDIFFSLLFIILGFLFINIKKNKNSISTYDVKNLNRLWVFHLIFSLIFYFYAQTNSADAVHYWKVAKNSSFKDIQFFLSQQSGTPFMYVINYVPSGLLDLSFFTGILMYSFLGFIAFYYFYVIAIEFVPYNTKFGKYNLFPLLFFFPNLHFWSCAIGKDTILFFSIGAFSYGILKPSKRYFLIVIGLLLSYLTRPHITLFLLVGFILPYIFSKEISFIRRIFISLFMFSGALYILPKVLKYSKIEDLSAKSLEQFNSYHSKALTVDSASSVDISSYSFPLKIFTFLFRPLFFDIRGFLTIFSSFENLFFLILMYNVFKNNFVQTFIKAPYILKCLFIFFLVGAILFSQSLGNLGVMVRMRNMFMPGVLIYVLWSYSFNRKKN